MSNLLRITNKIEALGIWDSIPSDSINSVVIEFEFAEDWKNLLCVAQFTQGEKTYNVVIENNRCVLPTELKIGNVMLSVFGTKTDGTPFRETSIPFCFEIYDAGFRSTAETPIPPTPDLYEQLIDKFSKDVVNSLNGKTGKVDIVADEGISVDNTETGKIKIKNTATITVDPEMSDTSENPVQNKVISETILGLDYYIESVEEQINNKINEKHPEMNGIRLFYTKTKEEVKAVTISSTGEPWRLKEFYLGIYIPASPELNSLDYIKTSILTYNTRNKISFTGRTVITGGTLGNFHRYIVFAHTGNGFLRFNSGIFLNTKKEGGAARYAALNCIPDGMGIYSSNYSPEEQLRAKEITISTTSTTATFPIGTEIEVFGI